MKLMRLFGIALVVSGLVVCGCVSQAPAGEPETTRVKVAQIPTTSNGPLFIAQEEGYFARQGIDVEWVKFSGVAAALPLLVNGDIAVSAGPLTPGLINAIAKGANVRIVAEKGRVAAGYCTPAALVVRRDLYEEGLIRNVSDLKGRKIMAISDQDYGMFRALSLGNLTTADVELIDMDFASGVIAFRNKGIDAAVLTEPYVTQALESGSVVVLVPGQEIYPDYPYALYYGPAILEKNPDLGRRFMIAYLQGVRQYNEGKTERNLEILQNYTRLDRELLNQSCLYPVAPDGNLPWKPVNEYLEWMYANKKIAQKPDENQLFDKSFVLYANAELQNMTRGG
jgi:NitT/TauT family transport system substrate-binding protein